MERARTYTLQATEAARLLGREIRLARKRRRWSAAELAARAGITRYTLQKIERGEMTCAIGLVFEAASLVGVPLFDTDEAGLRARIRAADDRIALLPKHTHGPRKAVDDDF
ncbi:MAG: helix-turn-helix transcriptional regulator [Rhodobacterales bacterium]|nr:helix-turn-helix transcriptional regulator [Rhodobacterales bacterium]